MIIRGILEYSLGGQLCIRGFAPLGELAGLSKPDESYQRPFIQDREQELKSYLQNEEYLFFSEIILSLDLKHLLTDEGSNELPLKQFESNSPKEFKSNIDGTELKEKLVSYRNKKDIRSKTEIRLVELILDDEKIRDGKRPFSRIDGNHRLSAVEHLNDSTVSGKDCPFCIILNSSVQNDRGLILQQENKKAERIIFNNINAKAVPLTLEQNLKAIILQDAIDGFDDEELKEKFDWATYSVRKLGIALIPNLEDVYPNLGTDFIRCPLTFSKKIIDIALTERAITESDEEIYKIKQSLREVNHTLGNENLTNISVDIVVACVFIQLAQMKLPIFINWLKRNHIFDLDQVHSSSLIKIYKKIKDSKSKQIFVSMDFSGTQDLHYEVICEAVGEINSNYNLDISLKQIRIDYHSEGFSHDINQMVLALIESSGLLIADLSLQNGNVYHEVGYLMGLNQGKGLPDENFILIKSEAPPFDAVPVKFNLTTKSQLRFKNLIELRKKLVESLKVYYQLV